jgi:hypothetical protein
MIGSTVHHRAGDSHVGQEEHQLINEPGSICLVERAVRDHMDRERAAIVGNVIYLRLLFMNTSGFASMKVST